MVCFYLCRDPSEMTKDLGHLTPHRRLQEVGEDDPDDLPFRREARERQEDQLSLLLGREDVQGSQLEKQGIERRAL